MIKMLKRFVASILTVLLFGIGIIVVLNIYVNNTAKDYIISSEKAAELSNVDAILVLGCQVNEDGTPSGMLKDRLICGVELYKLNVSPKLLMSGDHWREYYDEVSAMKQFAIDLGVPSEDVFLDHAGLSTYESMYRAKEIFGIDRVIVVTQEYHLYRAIYIARSMGIEAYGVAAENNTNSGQTYRDIREALAKCKDFTYVIIKPEPTHLGDAVDISGNGDLTNS